MKLIGILHSLWLMCVILITQWHFQLNATENKIIELSDEELYELSNNSDQHYVYLHKELSPLIQVITTINKIDKKEKSSARVLYKQIQKGFLIAPYEMVMDILSYATALFKKNYKKYSHNQAKTLFQRIALIKKLLANDNLR